jgi:hypothetical protein
MAGVIKEAISAAKGAVAEAAANDNDNRVGASLGDEMMSLMDEVGAPPAATAGDRGGGSGSVDGDVVSQEVKRQIETAGVATVASVREDLKKLKAVLGNQRFNRAGFLYFDTSHTIRENSTRIPTAAQGFLRLDLLVCACVIPFRASDFSEGDGWEVSGD